MLENPFTPEEERRARRVLEAAASSWVPDGPPPFFLARLRARLAEAERPHPVALAAARLLVAMLLLASGLSVWAVKEGADVARERDAALARAADQETSASDVVIAALLSGSGEVTR